MNSLQIFDPLDDFFRGFFVRPVEMGGGRTPSAALGNMRVDVSESNGNYVVRADLPGVKKEDIQVNIDDNVLTIRAECKRETERKEGERVVRQERYYGQVSRSFELPNALDEGKAEAKFENGVLHLTLPKIAAKAVKRLEIH